MQDLPDHVWSIIFDHLEYPIRESKFPGQVNYKYHGEGLQALSRLCQTSSRFLSLARRVLYRSLPLRKNILPDLLYSLHKHAHLRGLVQNLSMGDGVFDKFQFDYYTRRFYRKTLRQASFVPEDLEDAIGDVPAGDEYPEEVPDLWFAYCAILLPNLRLIECEARSFGEFLPAIIRNAAKKGTEASVVPRANTLALQPQPGSAVSLPPSQPLSKLREIRIGNQDTEFSMHLDFGEDLFLLPELQIFRGCAVELNTRLAERTPRPVSSLKHAYLDQSLADAEGVEDLLRTCPELQTLSIYWGSEMVGDSDLDFDHFGRALREHGQNLETLELECKECFSYGEEVWKGKIGDLTPLKRLKNLRLPIDIVLGSEDELSGMGKLGDSDGPEGGENMGVIPITEDSLEPLLPGSLVKLRFFSGYYDEVGWVRDSIQGVLSSSRLNQLKSVEVDLGEHLDVEWDKTGWWSKRHVGHELFYR